MADSGDHGADAAKNESEAAASNNGASPDRNLPMVVAPRLGAGEDEPVNEASAEAVKAAAAPSSPQFMLLAASVAFAAAFASFVGSVSGSGFARYLNAPAPAQAADTASQSAADTLRVIKQQLAELGAIKANLDSASRSTSSQFAKLSDRLDRLDQRVSAASETTGSIPASTPAPAAAPPAAEPAKLADRVLPDWVVQDVRSGRALVENRHGALFDVASGSVLPGLGRVAAIKRQDGQWTVQTESGTITSTGR